MKKLIIGLFLALGLVGCKTDCSDPSSIPSRLSAVIVVQWACTNPAQVQADLVEAASKHGLCTKSGEKAGPIASIVCPIVVQEIQSIAGNQVPASWGCDPSKVGANLAVALTAACMALPF